MDAEVQFAQALQKGIEAFQRGDVPAASAAFQQAYLIKPTDPRLQSWLAIVRDEQSRREAMSRTVTQVQEQAAQQAQAAATAETVEQIDLAEAADRSWWEKLSDPVISRLGLEQAVTPPESGRPEILDVTKRAGFQKLYKEGIGFQPFRGFGISGRTEIFEEPNPVDALVLDAKRLNFNELSQFRRSLTPLFTRSAATRLIADYEPFPRLTYEYDARTTLHQFETRFAFKDIDIQTHAFNALYSFPKIPLLGTLTVNPWYKRVLQSSHFDVGSYEHRDELIANFSLQPTENIEYFFQYDTYDARKTRTVGGSKLQLFKAQVRLRFPKLKVFAIPSVEYSDTTFDPSDDEFIKKTLFVDWGADLLPRLRFGSKQEWVFSEVTQAGSTPSNPTAEAFNWTNTLSYELFKDFDVSLGLDHGRNPGYNNFNNIGLRGEIELFKPGLIRSKLGYEWVSYYNISGDLHLLFWRFFLFQ